MREEDNDDTVATMGANWTNEGRRIGTGDDDDCDAVMKAVDAIRRKRMAIVVALDVAAVARKINNLLTEETDQK